MLGFRNIWFYQAVAARICHYVTASRQELLDDRGCVLRLAIAQVSGNRLLRYCQSLRFLLGAARSAFAFHSFHSTNAPDVTPRLALHAVLRQPNAPPLT